MKKLSFFTIIFSLATSIFFSSCKKNNVPSFANENLVTDSVLFKTTLIGGEFGDISRGNVSLEKLSGKKYLVFKNFTSSNGPAVHVYLSKTIGNNAKPATEFIDLGLLKATNGTFNYEITTNPDISVYKYVLVWCQQFSIQFGYGELVK